VQKFTNAIHRAQLWVAEHSAEEIADVVLPYFENTDRSIAISSIDRYKQQGSYASDPIVDEKEWNNLLDVMTSAGELKERAPYDKLVTTTFADEAIQSAQ
jgi:NitT/TauT family transport system substrate-binding protein